MSNGLQMSLLDVWNRDAYGVTYASKSLDNNNNNISQTMEKHTHTHNSVYRDL